MFVSATHRRYTPLSDRAANASRVRGVILAGRSDWDTFSGESALRSPLAPVALSPLISFALRWLRDGGISHVTVCGSGTGLAALHRYMGDGRTLGMSISYCTDASPRGPAGCVRDAAALTRDGALAAGDTFVVVDGTLIPSVDLGELLLAHWNADAAATVVTEIERRRNRLTGSAPDMPGGIYVFDARALRSISPVGYRDIKEGLLEHLYHAGERVIVHRVSGISPHVLDYRSYLSVNRWVLERTVAQGLTGYRRLGGALCHDSACVHDDASLVGPVLVGPDATIDGDAVVIGPTTVGAHSRIARGAVVSRSIVWDQCRIGENSVVDAAVLVSGVEILREAYVRGRVELPALHSASVSEPTRRTSPVWHLPVLPHTPLRSPTYAPQHVPLVDTPSATSLLHA